MTESQSSPLFSPTEQTEQAADTESVQAESDRSMLAAYEDQIEQEVEQRLDAERQKVILQTRREFQTQLELKIVEIQDTLQKQNQEAMQKVIADFRQKQTPPTEDEIRKMLNAEYLEFPVAIRWRTQPLALKDGKRGAAKFPIPEEITLGELPAATERKVMKLLQEKAMPLLQKLAPAVLSIMQGDTTDKIGALFELLTPATDVLQQIVAVILSAHTGQEISVGLIEENLSLNRQLSIVSAQLEANRLRDFFSRASRIAVR